MQPTTRAKSHAGVGISASSEEFASYCEGEFERRRNTGTEFDEASYREAMGLALAKLRVLEGEGAA
jgi:hypothetical protein